jgi:hypothetical protein
LERDLGGKTAGEESTRFLGLLHRAGTLIRLTVIPAVASWIRAGQKSPREFMPKARSRTSQRQIQRWQDAGKNREERLKSTLLDHCKPFRDI